MTRPIRSEDYQAEESDSQGSPAPSPAFGVRTGPGQWHSPPGTSSTYGGGGGPGLPLSSGHEELEQARSSQSPPAARGPPPPSRTSPPQRSPQRSPQRGAFPFSDSEEDEEDDEAFEQALTARGAALQQESGHRQNGGVAHALRDDRDISEFAERNDMMMANPSMQPVFTGDSSVATDAGLVAELQHLRSNNAALKSETAIVRQENATLKSKLAAMAVDLEELKSRHGRERAELERARGTAERELAHARAELQAARAGAAPASGPPLAGGEREELERLRAASGELQRSLEAARSELQRRPPPQSGGGGQGRGSGDEQQQLEMLRADLDAARTEVRRRTDEMNEWDADKLRLQQTMEADRRRHSHTMELLKNAVSQAEAEQRRHIEEQGRMTRRLEEQLELRDQRWRAEINRVWIEITGQSAPKQACSQTF